MREANHTQTAQPRARNQDERYRGGVMQAAEPITTWMGQSLVNHTGKGELLSQCKAKGSERRERGKKLGGGGRGTYRPSRCSHEQGVGARAGGGCGAGVVGRKPATRHTHRLKQCVTAMASGGGAERGDA